LYRDEASYARYSSFQNIIIDYQYFTKPCLCFVYARFCYVTAKKDFFYQNYLEKPQAQGKHKASFAECLMVRGGCKTLTNMYGNNNKNTASSSNGLVGGEDLLLQKMEENQRRMAALHAAMKQKTGELERVQQEIIELKKIQTA